MKYNIKLLLFSSPQCGPCIALDRILIKLIKNRPFSLKKINVNKNPDMATYYAVAGVPTTLAVDHNGKLLASMFGSSSTQGVEEWLDYVEDSSI